MKFGNFNTHHPAQYIPYILPVSSGFWAQCVVSSLPPMVSEFFLLRHLPPWSPGLMLGNVRSAYTSSPGSTKNVPCPVKPSMKTGCFSWFWQQHAVISSVCPFHGLYSVNGSYSFAGGGCTFAYAARSIPLKESKFQVLHITLCFHDLHLTFTAAYQFNHLVGKFLRYIHH